MLSVSTINYDDNHVIQKHEQRSASPNPNSNPNPNEIDRIAVQNSLVNTVMMEEIKIVKDENGNQYGNFKQYVGLIPVPTYENGDRNTVEQVSINE